LIKAVIFDWFNTLARYEPPREEIHSRALKEAGINIEPARLIMPLAVADKYFMDENSILPIRKRTPDEQAKIYIRYEEILMEAAGLQFEKALPSKIYYNSKSLFEGTQTFALFDDVIPTLKILKNRNIIIGLLTNFAKDMYPLIRQLKLDPYIDFVITPYEAHADKPQPEIFLAALKKAQVNAHEVIYVGDQYKVDILGARSANMTGILIDRYNLSKDDCIRISRLTEIVNYLS